ncbi:MAG: hypothetical protein ACXWJZ_12490 [Burkholderiaceae bacterium]
MMSIKATQPTPYLDAKLIDVSESEIVIECQSERIELPTHCYSHVDTIGKTGIAQYSGEGEFWGFAPYSSND